MKKGVEALRFGQDVIVFHGHENSFGSILEGFLRRGDSTYT